MKSVLCTLFESHYHYGLAVLANSAVVNNFRGEIFAGYRGDLPFWATAAKEMEENSWKGGKTLHLSQDVVLHLLPLTTGVHLTNYKPDFMLELWTGIASDAEIMYYLDPDIVLCKDWSVLEYWVNSGVALCEDVNSPLPKNHPRRTGWRNYFKKYGVELTFKDAVYVNGGCAGVKKEDIEFLHLWKQLQNHMAAEIGGLEHAGISTYGSGKRMAENVLENFAPFSKTDQDALNATIEAWKGEVSLVGKEAMGFSGVDPMLAHALGSPKPWLKPYLKMVAKGKYPTTVDKKFWHFANGVLSPFPESLVRRKKRQLKIATAIGKFYRNN